MRATCFDLYYAICRPSEKTDLRPIYISVLCGIPNANRFYDSTVRRICLCVFGEGRLGSDVLEHRMCFHFLYSICSKRFSFYEEFRDIRSQMYIGFYVKHPLLLSETNESLNFLGTMEKYSNINSNEIRPVELSCFILAVGGLWWV